VKGGVDMRDDAEIPDMSLVHGREMKYVSIVSANQILAFLK